MTKEKLLVPRWKVIADFPYSSYCINDVIQGEEFRLCNEEHITHLCNHYPELFKKLEWWEEREEKDLPDYVRRKDTGRIYPTIWKGLLSFRLYEPATEQEYLNQQA